MYQQSYSLYNKHVRFVKHVIRTRQGKRKSYIYLFNCIGGKLGMLRCKLSPGSCAIERLFDEPAPYWEEAVGEWALESTSLAARLAWPSTSFLERWRPRFRCLLQYFWLATARLEHRHLLPSVRRHLPGSGSGSPITPSCKILAPAA